MKQCIKPIGVLFFALFSCAVGAVDNPQDVLGSEKFDAMKCMEQNTQTCINSICLTSEQVDCQENCQKMAKEKCQQQLNE